MREWNMMQCNDGHRLPEIGFGTYKSTAGNGKEVLENAIRAGYRYFDTASFYENEEELGEAIKASGLKREDFILASKVWKTEMGYVETKEAFARSCGKLGTEYLDLYLIHWPKADLEDQNWQQKILDTWRAMEELQAEGKIKSIGVSNFLPHHLEVILNHGKVVPAVDQIEFHPGYLQKEVLEYCREKGILVQAWSPIGRARVLQDPLLLELAEKYQVSPAQICIKFCLQMGVLPLPKSSAPERMEQNLEAAKLMIQEEDMKRICAMPQTGWSGEHPDRPRVQI